MEKENIKLVIKPYDDNFNNYNIEKETIKMQIEELNQKKDAIIVPKLIFIIPYRDREQQQIFFSNHMKCIMSDYNETDYKILYIHQCDERDFNRGAMKNIGFLFVKNTYPDDYKQITLIFNDIDTMPFSKNFLNYDTTMGNIKHFYGFTYTLGGIVSVKAADFEKTDGFPNLWAWGYEDNAFHKRVEARKINIDRDKFFKIYDKNIMHFHDGVSRTVNYNEYKKYAYDYKDGISTINDLKYSYDINSGFVNVSTFNTPYKPISEKNMEHNLIKGSVPFKKKRRAGGMKMGI